MIRADIYFAFDYLHQKKIVDRLRFSALLIGQEGNSQSLYFCISYVLIQLTDWLFFDSSLQLDPKCFPVVRE
jgi:hypothetical protein